MIIHNLILYKNIEALENWGLQFCKTALFESNEIVLVLSSHDCIKHTLTELMTNTIHKNEGSLVVVDSRKGFYSMLDRFVGIIIMIKMLLTRSKTHGKNGVSVVADTGLFFHIDRINDLIEHEKMIISTLPNMKVKMICDYNTQDFARLNGEQKQLLRTSHTNVVSLD